jgi:hypothetical protein
MAWQPNIWTGDVRRVLYKRLLADSPRMITWTKTSSPGGERDASFDEYCKMFQSQYSALCRYL